MINFFEYASLPFPRIGGRAKKSPTAIWFKKQVVRDFSHALTQSLGLKNAMYLQPHALHAA